MRIRAGMGAFWAWSNLFCHRGAPLSLRMRLFHAIVTQIVCYAAGTKALRCRGLSSECILPEVFVQDGWVSARL